MESLRKTHKILAPFPPILKINVFGTILASFVHGLECFRCFCIIFGSILNDIIEKKILILCPPLRKFLKIEFLVSCHVVLFESVSFLA